MATFMGPWPKSPLVYEINTRVWLSELSVRAGRQLTLDQIPNEEFERISRMGFQCIWMMGVWPTGPLSLASSRTLPELLKGYREALPDYTTEDVIGSPYAVARYEVAPNLGGAQALAAMRDKLARFGMRLMLDFVPNHTALDYWQINENQPMNRPMKRKTDR